MSQNIKNTGKTFATLIHLSVFSMFFFPFGNLILPVILWSIKKEDPFVDQHGRSALNFQISMYLYTSFLLGLAVAGVAIVASGVDWYHTTKLPEETWILQELQKATPLVVFLIVLLTLALALFILQIIAVINASLKAGEGATYTYPLSINFLGKGTNYTNHQSNQSKNEQFNKFQKTTT